MALEQRETDLAWVAGFFDGDGSMHIARSKDGTRYTGGVQISQRREPGLLWEVRSIMMAYGLEAPPVSFWRTSNIFHLNFSSTKGSKFLRLILPYIRNLHQRQRAEIFLEMWPPDEPHSNKNKRFERIEIFAEWLKLRIREQETKGVLNALNR